MSDQLIDPSIEFGQTEGLFAFNIARAFDPGSARPDEPVAALAQDAVRTALRFKHEVDGEDASAIDFELAVGGLMGVLEAPFLQSGS